jgi:hypothetical protein
MKSWDEKWGEKLGEAMEMIHRKWKPNFNGWTMIISLGN